MFSIRELLGSEVITVKSNDDKACEAQGLATALLQLPILMYLNYCKWLADHSFVIGEKHKLISSVANKIKI